jgi:hypothetical protein
MNGMNPHDALCVDRQGGQRLRGKWLVDMSFLFAFCLEVIPIEMDVVSVLHSLGNLRLMLAVKSTCLLLIILPLAIYVTVNGPTALRRVWGRVTFVVVVVVINFAHNVFLLMGKL